PSDAARSTQRGLNHLLSPAAYDRTPAPESGVTPPRILTDDGRPVDANLSATEQSGTTAIPPLTTGGSGACGLPAGASVSDRPAALWSSADNAKLANDRVNASYVEAGGLLF